MQDIQDPDFFNLDDLIISPELAASRLAAPGSSEHVDPASSSQKPKKHKK